ncbi:MAG: hypothetical protein ACE5F7_05060 [Nitrospiria bacterium]
MLLDQKKIGVVFSEVDVRIVDCVFSPDGGYQVNHAVKIERGDKNDIELTMEIKAIADEHAMARHPASVTLPDQDFVYDRFFAPKLSKRDTRKMVLREVKKQLDLPEKDVLVDYHIGETAGETGGRKSEIRYLAAPRTHLMRYAEILTTAGLTVDVVVPSSMAMVHLMSAGMTSVGGPVAFIYLGANRTTIAVVEQDHVVFTRRLALSPFEPSRQFDEAGDADLTAWFDDAVREIKRTLLYCKKEIVGQDVKQVRIAAARPMSPEQVEDLKGKLGVDAVSLWQFENKGSGGGDVDPAEVGQIEKGYLFALGAAASAVRKECFHLLPCSLKMRRFWSLFFKAAASFLIFCLIGSLGNYFVQREKLQALQILAGSEISPALPEEVTQDTLERLVAEQARIRAKHEILSLLWHRRPPLQPFFQVLSRAMPKDAVLLEAEIVREEGVWVVRLDGKTLGRRGFDRVAAFSKWAEQLEASALFEEIVFSPPEDRPDMRKGMPFQIRAKFKPKELWPMEDADA